ncbi:hypothetical protein [Sodalis-like endosymbiont of Proechinophthirus fluctus]|uniref:hypothetical protein n=1 Tax=Sodalis-like endosymbiont of Proechinophthirus fluctus TaxID=1462730 RepID=UPI000A8F5D06|nr:hypothetical protein [Sodalis-like endosymbiont of Proechinophthirus fluctus]
MMLTDEAKEDRTGIMTIIIVNKLGLSINVDILTMVVENQLQRGMEDFYCCNSSGKNPF